MLYTIPANQDWNVRTFPFYTTEKYQSSCKVKLPLLKKIFLTIDGIIERVGNWGLVSSGVLILLMALLSTYAVGRRYLLNNPEPYSYELSTIFLTACVVLAVSGLQRFKRHLRVDFIANFMPQKVQTILLDIAGPILALVYVSIITWQSWDNALYSFNIGETSQSVWEEPLYPTKFLIPIGMFWLVLVLLAQITHGFVAVLKGNKNETQPDNTVTTSE